MNTSIWTTFMPTHTTSGDSGKQLHLRFPSVLFLCIWFGLDQQLPAHDLRFRCSRRFRNCRHWVAGDVHVRHCQYLIVEFWVWEWVWRRPPATWVRVVEGTGGVWWVYFSLSSASQRKVSRCSSVNFWSLTTFEAWIANGNKFSYSNVFSFFEFSVWPQNQDHSWHCLNWQKWLLAMSLTFYWYFSI